MKNLTQTDILTGLHTDFVSLHTLDLTQFTPLTDKMLKKFATCGKKIKNLYLPYYSKITNDCLDSLHSYLSLSKLKLKSHRD